MQLHMHTETYKSQLNVWAALACLASTNGTETDDGHKEAMQLHTDTHRRNKQVSTQCIGQQANKPWPVLLLPSTERQTMATGEAMQPPPHTHRQMQPHTHTEKKTSLNPLSLHSETSNGQRGCNAIATLWSGRQASKAQRACCPNNIPTPSPQSTCFLAKADLQADKLAIVVAIPTSYKSHCVCLFCTSCHSGFDESLVRMQQSDEHWYI